MKIYLVGYMCSGKSTVGKKLARKLGLKFCDTDKLFEEKFDTTVSDFFAQNGEETFREKEREILNQTLSMQNCVIATGGGMPCFSDNMDLMNKNGITIFLEISVKAILDRLHNSENSYRPLLKDIPENEKAGFIEQHLLQRKEFYQKADFTIKSENLVIEDLISRLISAKI